MTVESQKFSDEMAETGIISQSCKSVKCLYTENNAMTSPRKSITEGGLKAVMTWYDENSNYDFETGKPKGSMVIKDFTNLVWKGVKKVGIGGTVKQSNGFIYILVQFAPPANIPGQYLKNVFPAGHINIQLLPTTERNIMYRYKLLFRCAQQEMM